VSRCVAWLLRTHEIMGKYEAIDYPEILLSPICKQEVRSSILLGSTVLTVVCLRWQQGDVCVFRIFGRACVLPGARSFSAAVRIVVWPHRVLVRRPCLKSLHPL